MSAEHDTARPQQLCEQAQSTLDHEAERLAAENRVGLARARAKALATREHRGFEGFKPWLLGGAFAMSLALVTVLLPGDAMDARQTADMLDNMELLLWLNEHPEVL